ncbi:protein DETOXIFICATION 34 isoform X2 [Eucalyptus grandis]|uniref:protein DETOXIFICATION 34 isoform X2 n=1 Tax=Eucalyptus grandis TaxID=71139 RepID=UPI00192ED235|nr:protein DETOXIFICATION 34 isoform X2 [Eucalyptus grandis]
MAALGMNAAISVRVSNELGAAHPRTAKFSLIVAVISSFMVGLVLLAILLATQDIYPSLFSRDLRTYKPGGCGKGCGSNSTAPPCTGLIEMMAPVFSSVAWRCVWYMIQNDLIHAWGLDTQLGYCAQLKSI